MNRVLHTIVFAALSFFAGVVPVRASGLYDYFPLQTGTIWIYTVKTTAKPLMEIGTITRQVTGVHKGTYTINQYSDVMGAALRSKWTYTFTKAGLLEHGVLRHHMPTEKLLLKWPVKKGSTWHYKDLTFVIGSTRARVMTPAGEYTGCIHVFEYDRQSLVQEYWYKKDIGWVRIVSHPGAELLLKKLSRPLPSPPDTRLMQKKKDRQTSGQSGIGIDSYSPGTGLPPVLTFLDASGTGAKFTPSSSSISLPVILINFSDTTTLTTTTLPYFEQMLFSRQSPAPLYPYPSLALYYKDMSHGSLTVTGTVYGWFTATQTHDYYGTCNGTGKYGLCSPGSDALAREAISDACAAGVPFSSFGDQNGTRYVVVVHQGRGAEQTYSFTPTDIWSDEMTFGTPITCNGTTINGYILVPEQTILPYFDQQSDSNPLTKETGPIDIGVACHEFGHTLGLVDLYDPNWQTTGAYGIGLFDLMSYGGHGPYPTELSPWSRQFLGWMTPTTIGSNACNVTLQPIEQGGGAIRLQGPGMGPLEYFLVSNSTNTSFDRGLPGSGLLIWHIDDGVQPDSTYGDYNTCPWYPPGHTSCHYRVALVQADGTYDLEEGTNAADPLDYYTAGDVLSTTSTPSSMSYTGYNTDIEIENIRLNPDGSAVFNVILDPGNASPYITSTPPFSVSINAGSSLSFSLPVLGAQPMSYTVISGPAGLTVDPNGVVHWRPTVSDKGMSTADINISNCYGSTSALMQINVLTASLSDRGICALSVMFGSGNGFLNPIRDIRAKLMETHIGREFVHAYYYRISPFLVKEASGSALAGYLIRLTLVPLTVMLVLLLSDMKLFASLMFLVWLAWKARHRLLLYRRTPGITRSEGPL
ncbi:MAG: M6 family metalloprotease domain-containing protein [Deltaproteobacteria bacterium]|nr:M6 family metalloprotease domain-containing protein [Deltaproteobacteria bacterium]MCL5278153.1 M6 family metalloprotease domain-containing protein [Deltaproteobacteria bacterium]